VHEPASENLSGNDNIGTRGANPVPDSAKQAESFIFSRLTTLDGVYELNWLLILVKMLTPVVSVSCPL
jgi:hypothetical protein